jgi:glutaredoxin
LPDRRIGSNFLAFDRSFQTCLNHVEIFTGPGCSHCEQAKSLMKQHGFEYTERNISEPEVMIEFRERLPRARALLQIFADGKHLGGLEDLQFHLKQ